ncbi:MAG: hypothetical protein HY788_00735 [Deltaproteobacteria bacterium]|nr:hypothetical protein [Deltaproteobacteria bacterium]
MDIDWRKEYTRDGYRVSLAGSPIIMHCHHFNINLQTMAEETLGMEGANLMVCAAERASANGFRIILERYPQIRTVKSKIELAETLHQICGLGLLNFRQVGSRRSRVESLSSHHVTGWLAKHGRRFTPGCHFTRGWIAGILSVLYEREYEVEETACKLVKGKVCKFVATERNHGD